MSVEPYGRDVQVSGGEIPGTQTIIQTTAGTGLLGQLAQFFSRFLVHNRPKPFDYWVANTIVLPVGADTWVDNLNIKVKNRRSWAILNTSIVPGNNVWVNSTAMNGVGQGGLVAANFGTLAVPSGENTDVHAFPTAAGIIICFYQFA